ncbi:hypothetical protein JOM56_006152 [Amanita muscaria]
MSEVRTSLSPSLSFSAASSSESSLVRPQKRRISSSSDLFFTPSASSFKPRPYAPNPDSQHKTANRSYSRAQDVLAVPPLGMDPQPSDPNVVFIHPPFDVFPNSRYHLDGLSYALMAENPEWFLDPNDYISSSNTSPNAIPYPPHLEPPRGWCPAKKKDLRERGAEGWPEGEEPRLRCTFCRRTYAGVNAKSMWRRHVFEKHKIAMSNRRDGLDRPRGRGSNKENRNLSSKYQGDTHENLVNLDVGPQAQNRNVSHKSKFRTMDESARRFRSKGIDDNLPTVDDNGHTLTLFYASPGCSPFMPHSPIQDTVSDTLPIDTSELMYPASPPITLPVIPPSPYDPLLTPSFRHSSPRRPSEQPWRFPSPSHPLHSRSRDLSLSLLIRGIHSPIAKGSPAIGGTPKAAGASPFPSPTIFGKESRLSISDMDSPAKPLKYSPMSILCKGRIQLNSDRVRKSRPVEGSPLSRNYRNEKGQKRAISDLTDDWLADVPIHASNILSSNDPFSSIWNPVNGNNDAEGKPLACTDAVSPVLRSTTKLPSDMGLGIGLLDPFTLSEDGTLPSGIDSDFDGVSMYPPVKDDMDQPDALSSSDKESQSTTSRESTPPMKRRRTSVD